MIFTDDVIFLELVGHINNQDAIEQKTCYYSQTISLVLMGWL